MRHHGLGPIARGVDNHLFFHVRCKFLKDLNMRHIAIAEQIAKLGGTHTKGGCTYFTGCTLPDVGKDMGITAPTRTHTNTLPIPMDPWVHTSMYSKHEICVCRYYSTMASHPSGSTTSASPTTSAITATFLTSTSLTRPIKLHEPRQSSVRML